jgi:flagellar basal body-associated protein FliL
MEEHRKIDIMDIPDSGTAGNGSSHPLKDGTGPPAVRSGGGWRLALNRINEWIFINKILTLSIVGGLLSLGIIAGLWMILPVKAPVEKQSGISTRADSEDRYRGIRLDGFVVDVKDDGGNIRVLICDIVLEPFQGQSVKGIESRIDIRQVIYRILQSHQVGQLMSPEGRSALKSEIKGQLVRSLGEGKVKEVYFTRYMVL